MTTTQRFGAGIALAVAAIGLAGPVSAEPLSGSYTATTTGSSGEMYTAPGQLIQMTFTPCGPDCTHVTPDDGSANYDMHLQGNTWAGPYGSGGCNSTLDSKLVMTDTCPTFSVVMQLTKNG